MKASHLASGHTRRGQAKRNGVPFVARPDVVPFHEPKNVEVVVAVETLVVVAAVVVLVAVVVVVASVIEIEEVEIKVEIELEVVLILLATLFHSQKNFFFISRRGEACRRKGRTRNVVARQKASAVGRAY